MDTKSIKLKKSLWEQVKKVSESRKKIGEYPETIQQIIDVLVEYGIKNNAWEGIEKWK